MPPLWYLRDDLALTGTILSRLISVGSIAVFLLVVSTSCKSAPDSLKPSQLGSQPMVPAKP